MSSSSLNSFIQEIRFPIEELVPEEKKFSLSVQSPIPALGEVEGISSCGSKHDTLNHIKNALKDGSGSVPFFFGFTDAQIKPLLSPETNELWRQVCEIGRSSSLEDWRMSNILDQLKSKVEYDILGADLPLSESQRAALAACEGKELMIRSSSNEDTLDGVNAGGNVSLGGIKAAKNSLREALAKVVSSYFTYASLKNRSAFGDPFSAMPLCSVLVMEHINDKSDADPVVSGVMMTHKPAWIPQQEGRVLHIAASWGFGDGIVSGKVSCDEWILTEEQSYATIRQKPYRLAVTSGGRTEEIANAIELRERPVLSESQVSLLQSAARQLEEYFKRPMDVEFVIREERLYIVQARPIQASEMTSPTFIDPAAIPKGVRCFTGKTIVPGSSEVLSLTEEQILFAKSLESADRNYIPAIHRAVIVSTEPEGANTHAEVNFSSQRPPVPCFFLPPEEWLECRIRNGGKSIKVCPQTGLLIPIAIDLPIRKGLFLHPAYFPISVNREGSGLQGSSTPMKIVQLQSLLTATAEELAGRLDEIKSGLDHLFIDISARQACSGRLGEVASALQSYAAQIFRAMQSAAKNERPTSLSFHASALRQLLKQTAPHVVGAHSIAELEAATHLPSSIETFIGVYQDQKILCELAMLGRKAFDASMQEKWIKFLEESNSSVSEERWAELLDQMREFDSISQIALWFSAHFATGQPKIEVLLDRDAGAKKFSSTCGGFASRFHLLSEAVSRVSTELELVSAWEILQKESQAFLQFSSEHPKKNALQALQTSHLLYNLIQLWDLNIKTVRTSKILPISEVDRAFAGRIKQFAEFGQQAIELGIITNDRKMLMREVIKVLNDVFKDYRSTGRGFSLQHWLVPIGQVGVAICDDDERLTVIHQNLLKVSGLNFSEIAPFLPLALAAAVRIFQDEDQNTAKRFSEDHGIFASLTDERASVTINIPLNYHSFVVTMQQNRGSNAVEFVAYWRGSDNKQGYHFAFLQAAADLTGFVIRDFAMNGPDLKVTFSAESDSQIKMISRAISTANFISLSGGTYGDPLTCFLHNKDLEKEFFDLDESALKNTKIRVLDHLWQQFTKTGDMNRILEEFVEYGRGLWYLKKRGLLPDIIARVADELEGRRPKSLYSKLFLHHLFKETPLERQKEILWNNLVGTQTVAAYSIPAEYRDELLRRLCQEAPIKAISYSRAFYYDLKELEPFIQEIETAGPKSPEQAELLAAFGKIKK